MLLFILTAWVLIGLSLAVVVGAAVGIADQRRDRPEWSATGPAGAPGMRQESSLV